MTILSAITIALCCALLGYVVGYLDGKDSGGGRK